MPTQFKPSFSRHRKWRFGFDAALRTAVVFAVVVMVNYLGRRYYHRQFLSEQTRIQLSSRTINVLNALTNQVKVTLYYDKDDRLYPDVLFWLVFISHKSCWPSLELETVPLVIPAIVTLPRFPHHDVALADPIERFR